MAIATPTYTIKGFAYKRARITQKEREFRLNQEARINCFVQAFVRLCLILGIDLRESEKRIYEIYFSHDREDATHRWIDSLYAKRKTFLPLWFLKAKGLKEVISLPLSLNEYSQKAPSAATLDFSRNFQKPNSFILCLSDNSTYSHALLITIKPKIRGKNSGLADFDWYIFDTQLQQYLARGQILHHQVLIKNGNIKATNYLQFLAVLNRILAINCPKLPDETNPAQLQIVEYKKLK